MATLTKTVTEADAEPSGAKSTWTLAISASDVTATGGTFNFSVIFKAKYSTYSGKAYANIDYVQYLNGNGSRAGTVGTDTSWIALAGNTYKTFTTTRSIDTSIFFNTSNPTISKVAITLADGEAKLISGKAKNTSTTPWGKYVGFTFISGTLAYVTLNAPPTFTSTQVSFDKSYVYKSLTTASVTVSDATAQWGGYIKSIKLTIGSQSVTKSYTQTSQPASSVALSLLLQASGTFTPTVTVTDSRNQTTTKTLNPITVTNYYPPELSYSIFRTNSNGIKTDEGTYALITAGVTHAQAVANLLEPTVTVEGENTTGSANITWYEDWDEATGIDFATAVDWTNYNPTSPTMLYGLSSGFGSTTSYDIRESYQFTVTASDTFTSGSPITQTLATAFYTIDFLAGGYGVAFGQLATDEGFWCNMPATFQYPVATNEAFNAYDDASFRADMYIRDASGHLRSILNALYPVGSCYTTNTNTNPSAWLGGTWTLIHKKFKSQNITTGFTFNTTNTQSGQFSAWLNGNTIEFRWIFQNVSAISDTTMVVGTLNIASVGISSGEHGLYPVGFSDGLNAVILGFLDISATGTKQLQVLDWVTRATTYPTATGQSCDISCVVNCRTSQMLDSFCDEFVWQRTALYT